MIKLFRRFRQKLLRQGNPGKYILYAVGEILLVVIGILIALQVNNWNESRKSKDQEIQYFNRLIVDLNQDLNLFRQDIREMEAGNRTIEALSEALKDENDTDSLLIVRAMDYFKYGSIYPVFTSAQSTFKDLSSTGNLKVISKPGLRDAIVKHYTRHHKVAERVEINKDWALPLDSDFTYELNIMQLEPMTAFLFPEKPHAQVAQELRKNQYAYITNASVHYWINNDIIAQLKDLILETETLLELINKGL